MKPDAEADAPQRVIEEMAKAGHNSMFVELWDDMARNSISRAAHIESIEAALSAAKAMGWVLVPVEPTEDMLKTAEPAIDKYYDNTKDAPFDGGVRAVYQAMLAARATDKGE
jgi:hypothetical protein